MVFASETVIARYGNGNVKITHEVIRAGGSITNIDRQYTIEGAICYYNEEEKKGDLVISYKIRGQKGCKAETLVDKFLQSSFFDERIETGKFEYYNNGRLKHRELKVNKDVTKQSFDANGNLLHSIEIDIGGKVEKKFKCRNNTCVLSYNSVNNKILCSDEKECEKMVQDRHAKWEQDRKRRKEEELAKQRAIEEEKLQERIKEEEKIKAFQRKKNEYLARFDTDHDGFCSGEGMTENDVERFCKGIDVCPESQGDEEGCTKEARLIHDYDEDRDGFCSDSKIYEYHKNVFKGVDLCPAVPGQAYGCPKQKSLQWYENFKEIIRNELDRDGDGFCNGRWYSVGRDGSLESDDEIIYAYRSLHTISKEKLNEIADNVYYEDKSPYVHAFYSDEKILKAVHSVCKGYDACPSESGVAPDGCSDAYNLKMKRQKEERELNHRRQEERYQREKEYRNKGNGSQKETKKKRFILN